MSKEEIKKRIDDELKKRYDLLRKFRDFLVKYNLKKFHQWGYTYTLDKELKKLYKNIFNRKISFFCFQEGEGWGGHPIKSLGKVREKKIEEIPAKKWKIYKKDIENIFDLEDRIKNERESNELLRLKKELCFLTDCYKDKEKKIRKDIALKVCEKCGTKNLVEAKYCCECATSFIQAGCSSYEEAREYLKQEGIYIPPQKDIEDNSNNTRFIWGYESPEISKDNDDRKPLGICSICEESNPFEDMKYDGISYLCKKVNSYMCKANLESNNKEIRDYAKRWGTSCYGKFSLRKEFKEKMKKDKE